MTDLDRAILELETYEQDVKDGKIYPDRAYHRALLMRIDMLRESEKNKPDTSSPEQ